MEVNGKNKIRWVAIQTDKGIEEIINLTNQTATDIEGREDYYRQIHAIDNGRFIIDFIMGKNYEVTDDKIYDPKPEKSQVNVGVKTAPAPFSSASPITVLTARFTPKQKPPYFATMIVNVQKHPFIISQINSIFYKSLKKKHKR